MIAATAFSNDPAVKARLVAMGEHHRAADMLVKGTYGNDDPAQFKGCSLGCYFNQDGSNINEGFKALVPSLRLRYFVDALFELLPDGDNTAWHVQWPSAIPLGATAVQIDHIMDRLQLFSLKKKAEWFGLDHNFHIAVMVGLFDRVIQGDTPTDAEWNEAARAARAACDACDARAARAARAAWAAWAAWDARDARAAWAAWSERAAWDARNAWDAWAAWSERDARDAWNAWSERDTEALNGRYRALRDAYLKEMAGLSETMGPKALEMQS